MKRYLSVVLCCVLSSVAFASDAWHALLLSDVHLLPQSSSQTTYYQSDTGLSDLWPSAKKEIQQLIKSTKPRFVLLLGDLPGHHMSLDDMALADQQVFGDMSELSKGRPWFYVTGNNDSLTGDYHSFSHLDDSGKISNLLTLARSSVPGAGFDDTCDGASKACVIDSGSYNGTPYYFAYYSAYPTATHHMRLIVLNSVLWLTSRYVSDDGVSQQQAGDQEMQWLREQLSQAALQDEQVLIAMHVPSGISSYTSSAFWQSQWQSQWDDLMSRYYKNIALIVNGHTHMNALSLMHFPEERTLASLTVPGITPLHYNNPGMVDSVWQLDAAGRTQWFDANVYAYLPNTKRWSLAENIRQTYAPMCQSIRMTDCLASLSHDQFNKALDTYFTLQPGKTPKEGWDAVNQAAQYSVSSNA